MVSDAFSLITTGANGLAETEQTRALLRMNDVSERYGLRLTEADARMLVQARREALHEAGRFEFGGGCLPALIQAFCDSPFICQQDYADTLRELQQTFYAFKTDSEDAFSDEELIALMKAHLDGPCQGSLEMMRETTLGDLVRAARGGFADWRAPGAPDPYAENALDDAWGGDE